MLKQETLDKMHAMKMHATAEAFEHQSGSSQWADLSFEDRVGMLIDAEWTSREQRKTSRRCLPGTASPRIAFRQLRR